MIKGKRSSLKIWLLALSGLLFWGAVWTYFVLHPAMPSYIKPPPGSEVLESRRFLVFMWGPEYYCRIHSPLGAWKTASLMRQSAGFPQYPAAASRLGQRSSTMGGCALRRGVAFVSMNYRPFEMQVGHGEFGTEMRIWPEASGSTIEFFVESRF